MPNRPGRPPTPIERKRKTGNPGKRKLPSAMNVAAVPAIELDAYERPTEQAFDEILSAGVSWISATDGVLVSLLRESIEAYTELRDNPMASPKDVRDARKEIGDYLRDLGFTPGERARLGLAEVKAQSKLEEMRARRSASSAVLQLNRSS